MRCVSPILIRAQGRRDWVPCGKCNFCLALKRNDWSMRLQQEMKHADTAYFLTMTYNDDSLPVNEESGLYELCKRDTQLFIKRVRKDNALLTRSQVRYYLVGEYGTKTERPHYHALMFNVHYKMRDRLDRYWQLGHVHVGDVTAASIHYVTKYVINRHVAYSGREPPFSLCSKRPGIGLVYTNTHMAWHRVDGKNYTRINGIYGRIPRYLRDKMFSKDERAQLADESIVQSDLDYADAITALGKYHVDPYAYYDERINKAHDQIFSKINQTNLF